MKKSVFQANNLQKNDNERTIFEQVTFDVDLGESIGVFAEDNELRILFDCLTGQDTIDGGEIILEGKNFNKMREDERARTRAIRIGLVNLEYLQDEMTAKDFMHIPLLFFRESKEQKEQRINSALEFVGLENAERKISQLSKNEKVLLAIASGFVRSQKVIITYNITDNLEKKDADKIRTLLNLLSKVKGKAVIQLSSDWNNLKLPKIYKIKKGKLK